MLELPRGILKTGASDNRRSLLQLVHFLFPLLT
jgi:hypothetical protein